MTIYRAAYWTSEDRQGEIALTSPEHADMDDEDLLAEAEAEAARIGLVLDDGTIEIGAWNG